MRALVGASLAAMAACTGASPDPGLGARVQVPGAQYRPGPFPDDSGGPATLAIQPDHATVTVGRLHDSLHGQFDRMTTSAIIGVAGAEGAWIVPAGPPDISTTDEPSVTVTYGLGDDAPLGPTTLLMAAGDADGHIGPAAQTDVVAALAPPPAGQLVISLEWTSTADLDLHVVDALGGEAWSDSPNTWQPPPPGEPLLPMTT